MDDDLVVDVVIWDAQIAGVVSGNDMMTDLPPLSRVVELLIEIAVKPKRGPAYAPSK